MEENSVIRAIQSEEERERQLAVEKREKIRRLYNKPDAKRTQTVAQEPESEGETKDPPNPSATKA